MHSYTFHEHELKVAEIAKALGFTNISLSSQIMPMVRLVPRGFTASVGNVKIKLTNQSVLKLCNLNSGGVDVNKIFVS